jgi:micrococcal nuclease
LDCLSGSPDREQGVVTGVIDGQSIVVQIDGVSHTVRYISVDAPLKEDVGDQSRPDAASRNAALVLDKTVWLVKDVRDSDKFGRQLRYVLVGDLFVNYELARGGYAYVYPYPPDTACYAALKYAEGQAQAEKLGIWSPPFEPTGTQVLIIAPTPTGGRVEPDIPCSCSRDLYNCNDFETQEDAQICFDFCWVVKDKDIHKLDRDFDGLACK